MKLEKFPRHACSILAAMGSSASDVRFAARPGPSLRQAITTTVAVAGPSVVFVLDGLLLQLAALAPVSSLCGA